MAAEEATHPAHLGEPGGFTRAAMEHCAAIRKAISELPFLSELCAGTLPQEAFTFYLAQDSLYLREYSKVLALLAAKAPRPEITSLMATASSTTLQVEGSLHATFLEGAMAGAVRTPTCEGYTNFLKASAHGAPYAVGFAAAIPCYTVYCEVGELICQQCDAGRLEGHPYASWISTYGGEFFQTATRKATAVLDELARSATSDERAQMMAAFEKACRFEWMFWSSAYEQERWPLNEPHVGAPTVPPQMPSVVSVVHVAAPRPTDAASVTDPSPSVALWRAAEPSIVAALHGRFCSGLAAGTLPRAAFGAYIAQDHFFLASFADAYANALARLPTHLRSTLGPKVEALLNAANDEREGHAANAARWGVVDIASVQPLPATREYCDLLTAAATHKSLGVLFAAAAPCMRLYAYLGQQLQAVAAADTPYKEWIEAYGSTEFEGLALAADELLETFGEFGGDESAAGGSTGGLGGGVELEAYLAAMRLEVAFFDQVPGVPALQAPPSSLAVDFDGTLTQRSDSTSEMLRAVARSAVDATEVERREEELAGLVQDYVAGKRAHDAAANGTPPAEALEAQMKFEETAYQPLARAFRGATHELLAAVGANLALRPSAMRVLGLARAKGVGVHVITLNPSIDCVVAALRLQSPDSDQPTASGGTRSGVTLHATELGFDDKGVCTGEFGRTIFASGAGKAKAWSSVGLGEGGGTAYVGDSTSDLPTMRLSRLPIAIGEDASLLATAAALGMRVLPLAAATVALASPAGLPAAGTTLYVAPSWEAIGAVLLPPPPPEPTSAAWGTGVPRVLIVAGSDSGGGAGIQADLKACEANGAFGMTAITALTAQNTIGVQGVELAPAAFVELQMTSVLGDLGADAIKTGMLPSAAMASIVAAKGVAAGLVHRGAIVIDPVLVTSSGVLLVPREEVGAIARTLFPLAEVITPNVPEAEVLLRAVGCPEVECVITDLPSMHRAAARLHAFGSRWVLLKGGHLEGMEEAVDVLYGGDATAYELRAPRVATRNTHGTGCTLASTLAALLARGHGTLRAVTLAKAYLHGALSASADLTIGGGPHGPLHHSYAHHAWPPPPPTAPAPSSCSSPPSGVASGGDGSAERNVREIDLSVYVITDAKLDTKHGRSIGESVRAAVRGGATIVQVRDKNMCGRELVASAKEAVAAAAGSGVPVLINDRVDVALACGAAGVHLGQEDLDVSTARRLLGPHAIIGATAKTAELAAAAVASGADYVGSGAVYPTATKTSSCIGLSGLRAVCEAIPATPVVGIGGVDHANAAAVIEAGADGVAVVSAVFDAVDVEGATAALRKAVLREGA